MGLRYTKSRTGSHHASFEKTITAVSAEIETLQARVATRRARKASGDSQILLYGLSGFAIVVGLAAWAINQPPGSLSQRQHVNCVLPVFLEPAGTFLLWTFWGFVCTLGSKRTDGRLQKAQARRQKLISELKDATNYERTLGLLRRFDPEFQEPDSAQKRGPGLRMVQSQPFNQAGKSPGPTETPRGGPGLRHRMLPTLDKVASALVGDSPFLANTLREAKIELEMLRHRLQKADARIQQLSADNAGLRERLGEPPEEPESDAREAGEDTQSPDLGDLDEPLGRLRISSAAGPMDRQRSCSAPVTPLSRLNPRMEALRGLSNVPPTAADSLGSWDLPPGEPAGEAAGPGAAREGGASGSQPTAAESAAEPRAAAEPQRAAESGPAVVSRDAEADVSGRKAESSWQHNATS